MIYKVYTIFVCHLNAYYHNMHFLGCATINILFPFQLRYKNVSRKPEIEVAAGTDIIKRSMADFLPSTVATTMMIDLLAYDNFPALAALEDA